MSVGTIFFSYSRDNTEFVLNLAKELREAGADVWLDQLDIQPGSRWDKSIENALVKSQTLLVILSKSSVESNNVMDEVSFALEEGKSIVPVLLEDCDIPFRLRRLQFADFSKDHTKGIKSLINALHLKQSIALKLTREEQRISVKTTPNVQSPIPLKKDEKAEPISVEAPNNEVTKLKKSKNKILFSLFFVIIAIGVFFAWLITKPTSDEANWQKIKKSNKINLYDAHLLTFVECTHKRQAILKIDNLKKAQADRLDWEKIKNSTSFEDFDRHIEAYPKSKYNNLAKVKLKQLTAVAKEKADLNDAIKQNKPAAIKKYLKTYPSGMYQKEADSVLKSFNAIKLNKDDVSDWNRIKYSNNSYNFKRHLAAFSKCIHKRSISDKLRSINNDISDWNRIKNSSSSSTFSRHLRRFPNCLHKSTISIKLRDIRYDIADWKKIFNKTNPYYFNKHLSSFPNCIHKVTITSKLKDIRLDNDTWKNIKKRPNAVNYLYYIRTIGKEGIYFNTAKKAIYKILKNKSAGYVYIGNLSKDKKYLTKKRNYNNYKVKYYVEKPKVGDLEECLFDNPIYKTASFKYRTASKITKKQIVVVLQVYYIGNQCWIKIARI